MSIVKKLTQITQELSHLDIGEQKAIVSLIEKLKERTNNKNNLYVIALPKSHQQTNPLPQWGNDTDGLKSLISNLLSSEFLGELEQEDPLLEAKLKGVQDKQKLLNYQGQRALTSNEVAAILGISRQAVDNRRKTNTLLGISFGKRGFRYPAWQFANGDVLAGWSEVLNNMDHLDDWSKLIFMLTGDIRLNHQTPLQCLQNEQINEVIMAAKAYGLQYPA